MRKREREFYELFGSVFEDLGSSRMMGRICGMMMIGDHAGYTMGEIVDQIGTAKSTVSQSLKYLTQMNLVEKYRQPGQRADHYRMRPEGWAMVGDAVIYKFTKLVQTIEQSLELLNFLPEERLANLRQMGEMYRFFLAEWPKLGQAWQEHLQQGATS